MRRRLTDEQLAAVLTAYELDPATPITGISYLTDEEVWVNALVDGQPVRFQVPASVLEMTIDEERMKRATKQVDELAGRIL